MILNLLTTLLVLSILGAIFLLVAYLTSLAVLLFVPWTQAYLVFAHWLRLQNPARLLTPEAYTLRPFTTRNIKISTSDGLRLGAWHILPADTPRTTLERIQTGHQTSDPAQDFSMTQDSIFEDTLKTADKVVLYFHGQVGDRGKSNRIATYKGIQAAIPSAHVVTIDCRGYGDSEGFPSEAGFKIDALAAWSWITKRVSSQKVVIYGHSLGSGIATNLCLQLEEQQVAPLALILDAAFTSMPDMMTAYRKIPIVRPFARFPLLLNHFKLRLMDRFETVRAVETIRSPLLLIHGQEDADVLITNSHTLFHTALTARRLLSSTKELAVTEAGEAASAEDEMARAGLELSFQFSHSTGREDELTGQHSTLRSRSGRDENADPESGPAPIAEDTSHLHNLSRPPSSGSDSGLGSEATSGKNSRFAISPQQDPKESMEEVENDQVSSPMGTGHEQCHTVQLDFPREGSLEYNQDYQIGFLTVQYAVHNTCLDFGIGIEVLGMFIKTIESRLEAMADDETAPKDKRVLDLAKVIQHEKVGYVDQSEVPEVVE